MFTNWTHTHNPHPDQDTAYEQCPRIPTSLPFLITVTPPGVTTTLTSNSKDYFYLFLNICILNVCDFFTLHDVDEIHLRFCVWLRIVLSHRCLEFHCGSIHFLKIHSPIDGHLERSGFWLLWELLLWTFSCMLFSAHQILHISAGKTPRTGIAGDAHAKLPSLAPVFHDARMRFLVAARFCQNLIYIFLSFFFFFSF